MKLKTLKDIEKEVSFITITYGNQQITPVKMKHPFSLELKKEAIKWIKNDDELCKFFDDTTEVSSCIKWIKHFFNITGEDLK